MNWYGLYEDGELVAVRQFFNPPNIFDFEVGFSSAYDYDIVLVDITPRRE